MKTPAREDAGMSVITSASRSQRTERNTFMEKPSCTSAARGERRDLDAGFIPLKHIPPAKVAGEGNHLTLAAQAQSNRTGANLTEIAEMPQSPAASPPSMAISLPPRLAHRLLNFAQMKFSSSLGEISAQ
jgi:hypothetical protein